MRFFVLLALFVVAALPAVSQVLLPAAPEEAGMSAERLSRINEVIRRHIERKEIAGAVTLIARRGRITHFAAHGMADVEAGKPMKEDTIFRIASMSKPITSVAVMMLYEEGKFMLGDPVGKYIAEFAKMEALPGPEATNNYRVPAKRPMTIRNLLTHTSGLTYGDGGLEGLYRAYDISSGLGQTPGTIGEMVKRLGGIPLAFHPGDRYNYGLSIDVLGALVEVWSGQTFAEFLDSRVFGPLGMKDTHFFLTEGKEQRLARVYHRKPGGQIEPLPEYPREGYTMYSTSYPYKGPKTYYSGGAGLSSTALDYARFAQMILNGGELGGQRLLSPATVKLMTMDHAGKIVKDGVPRPFGLGFYVESGDHGLGELTSEGTHGWGGHWYTQFFVSPEEEMVGVFMAQLQPNGGLQLHQQFKILAHQAIVD